jgi:hypothetical protein
MGEPGLGIPTEAVINLHYGEAKAYQLPPTISDLARGAQKGQFGVNHYFLKVRGYTQPVSEATAVAFREHLNKVSTSTKGRTAWVKKVVSELDKHMAFVTKDWNSSRTIHEEWMVHDLIQAWLLTSGYKLGHLEVEKIAKKYSANGNVQPSSYTTIAIDEAVEIASTIYWAIDPGSSTQ